MGIADTIESMVSYEKRKRNRKAKVAILKRQKFKCNAIFVYRFDCLCVDLQFQFCI